MSATDTRAEFFSDLDDWWAQLWALRISVDPPQDNIKQKFFTFVEDRCAEVDCWRLGDHVLGSLFSEFINDLGEW